MYNVVKCFVCCAMFCLQAKLSRFMDWAIKFRNLRPYWSFLRKVYETYKILKGQARALPVRVKLKRSFLGRRLMMQTWGSEGVPKSPKNPD